VNADRPQISEPMQKQLIAPLLASIAPRAVGQGGFAELPGGESRVDASAWTILALRAGGGEPHLVEKARASLAAGQLGDGRVSLGPQHPEAFWPTSLAILAWHQAPAHAQAQTRAVQFLLQTSGRHGPRPADAPFTHDSNLQGWPWIAETSAWVEPTALAMIALRVAGLGEHARVQEGARLLLDRQLPHGGWNCGNTVVFGQELQPYPESTGLALNALQGAVPREHLARSLSYLQTRIRELRTPLALGWGLLGLGAWGERPGAASFWLSHCLQRQNRYTPYNTSSLALLLVASQAAAGLESVFS
jgi:hypothetical protein